MPSTLYTQIQEWDRRSDPDSKGALAFYAFKKALGGEAAKQDRASCEPVRRATPRGRAQGRCLEPVDLRRSGGPVRPLFPRRPPGRRPLVAGRRRQLCKDVGMATPRAISFAAAP